MAEEDAHYRQLGSEYEKERVLKMNEYVQKMNNVNSVQFLLHQQPLIIMNMNPDISKKLSIPEKNSIEEIKK